MPPALEDPPLQPGGSIEATPRDWKCESCLEGTQCSGGTADSIQVKPGWFAIRSLSLLTGAEKRPNLWRCIGGKSSCPGGTSISKAMGAVPPGVFTTSRACESITKQDGFDAARLQQYPQCQCGPGGTGLLCHACKSSAVAGGNDWIKNASGVGCHECSMRSGGATFLVGATTFGFIVFILCVVLLRWRYTRPSVVERRFVDAFARINELGADRIVKEFFNVPIGSGISKDVFVAAVMRNNSGGNGGDGGAEKARTETHARKLWAKLDEDGDSKVTLDEFVTFVCDLRDGKQVNVQSKYGKACFACIGSVASWWQSMKVVTLKAVIITHFQLMSSISATYPELNVRLDPNAAAAAVATTATTVAASNIKAGAQNNNTTPVMMVKKTVGDVTGAVSNLNVAVFEFIGCFVGPRHEAKLLYTTVTALTLMAVASLVPWIVRRCLRERRIAYHDSNLIAGFEHFFLKSQLVLVFLVYPALTMTIMRTFVCKQYAQDDQGNPTWWLVDDTVMQCETFTTSRLIPSLTASMSNMMGSTTTAAVAMTTTAAATTVVAATSSNPYVFLYVYSWCMVVVVVLGFPAFLLFRLWYESHPTTQPPTSTYTHTHTHTHTHN